MSASAARRCPWWPLRAEATAARQQVPAETRHPGLPLRDPARRRSSSTLHRHRARHRRASPLTTSTARSLPRGPGRSRRRLRLRLACAHPRRGHAHRARGAPLRRGARLGRGRARRGPSTPTAASRPETAAARARPGSAPTPPASRALYFEEPTLAKVQIPDGFDNRARRFVGQFLTMGRPPERRADARRAAPTIPQNDGQPRR